MSQNLLSLIEIHGRLTFTSAELTLLPWIRERRVFGLIRDNAKHLQLLEDYVHVCLGCIKWFTLRLHAHLQQLNCKLNQGCHQRQRSKQRRFSSFPACLSLNIFYARVISLNGIPLIVGGSLYPRSHWSNSLTLPAFLFPILRGIHEFLNSDACTCRWGCLILETKF